MKTGTLILVATPIGNLGDISARVADTLRRADIIYCEDTRHSRQLLTHLGIQGQTVASLHEHNEVARIQAILGRLEEDQTVAVVSDAGMPVISDPGQQLVAAAVAAGHRVTAVPGPNAALMALAISGLPAERWHFEGFLPTRGKERTARLQALANLDETAIIYEAPQRVAQTIKGLLEVSLPERRIAIARELTKLHEEIWRGTLADAVTHLERQPARGEYCLVLEGAPSSMVISDEDIRSAIEGALASGVSVSKAASQVSSEFELSRKRVYALALAIRDRR